MGYDAFRYFTRSDVQKYGHAAHMKLELFVMGIAFS